VRTKTQEILDISDIRDISPLRTKTQEILDISDIRDISPSSKTNNLVSSKSQENLDACISMSILRTDKTNNLTYVDILLGKPILDYQLSGLSDPINTVKVSCVQHGLFSKMDNYIGLDTMSEISIFKKSLMLDTKSCNNLLVSGVNGDLKHIVVNEKGCSILGLNTYCSDRTVGNILSFADARDNSYSLQWNTQLDQFELQVFENGETYIFKRVDCMCGDCHGQQ
jgi:hypothetical protein